MPLPYAFANVTALLTPQLDADFNALGALTVIPCTASGTNTILLTPATNSPLITAYTSNSPMFGFVASGTSTGAVTISISGVGAKNVYKNNGATLIGSNDFISGRQYYVSYNAALGSGAGGWVVLNSGSTAAAAGSIQGAAKNLAAAWATNTTATITADALAVSDGASSFTSLLGVSQTVNSALSGPGGLDTGSLALSTWYAIYTVYNPATLTTSAMISTSFVQPSFTNAPGFTQYAFVGAIRTDASTHFIGMIQKGKSAQWLVGSNLAALPVIVHGSNSSVLTAASIAAVCPTAVASKIKVTIFGVIPNTNTGAVIAPNASYGSLALTTVNPGILSPAVQQGASDTVSVSWAELVLESTNIYYASDTTVAFVYCAGWEYP